MTDHSFEIFLTSTPGLEGVLREELVEKGFPKPIAVPGGVAIWGGWPAVWRACLEVRGAGRALVRIGRFHAVHLSELERRTLAVDWAGLLPRGAPVAVEAVCRKSRIYHSGAAIERVQTALAASIGARPDPEAPFRILVRIEKDEAVLSLDAAGDPLHKRGFKAAVAKAPMRETLAALFLRACGYKGKEPVLDPMCGSGTFVIEAAEIAARLAPGRARRFAFEDFICFDETAYGRLRERLSLPIIPEFDCVGLDRDPLAIRAAIENAERAGVEGFTRLDARPIHELERPDGPPGLVMINPPYGSRIGDKRPLKALHRSMGERLLRFKGWRIGLVTSEDSLARATALPFGEPSAPVDHGGLKIRLWRTGPLA